MNTWKIILATVVIFAAGVITGGLLVSHANRINARQVRRLTNVLESWHPRERDILRPDGPGPQPLLERQRMEFILAVHRELNLTPQQRRRIEKIVREGQEKTKAILENVRPELREEWQEVHEKIRAELTPAQRKRFEELLKQRPPRLPEPSSEPGRGPRDQRLPVPPRDLPSPEGPPTMPSPTNPPPPDAN